MVLDIADGKVGAHHLRYLPGEAAGGVDHGFGDDRALFRDHFPFAARPALDAGHPVAPHSPCALGARSPGHGLAQSERVGVTVVAGPGSGQHAFGGNERIELANLVNVDDFHVVTDVGGDAAQEAEPVQILLGQGETDAAAAMPTDVLTRQSFQIPVQGVAVFVNLGEIVVADQVGTLAGRVPGRTRSQLALLDQQDIAAALRRQVVEQADTHDAAADDDDLSLLIHGI